MNLSLQQALKYGTKEDLIASAVNSPEWDPTHLLIAADAHEEAGEEGVADLLRAGAKGREVKRHQSPLPDGYGAGATLSYPKGQVPEGGTHWYLSLVRKLSPDRINKPHALLLDGLLRGRATEETSGPTKRFVVELSPQEAKAATARLPNATEIHQFIDHHFPEPKPESEAN